MNFTKQQILDDYQNIAQQVIDYYYALPPAEQTQHELTQSSLYGWVQGCQGALAAVAMSLPGAQQDNAVLIVDGWGWIPHECKDKMKQEQHPMYLAACECGEE